MEIYRLRQVNQKLLIRMAEDLFASPLSEAKETIAADYGPVIGVPGGIVDWELTMLGRDCLLSRLILAPNVLIKDSVLVSG